MNAAPRTPLLITLGDPCGIGPEIVLQALRQSEQARRDCVCVGDLGVLERIRDRLGLPVELQLVGPPPDASPAPAPPRRDAVRVWQTGHTVPDLPWGHVSAAAGAAAQSWVEAAARACLSGHAAGMVTAPLHKEALAAARSAFPGHTELLQWECARHLGVEPSGLPVRMMLANDELRTVLVSIHLSLRQAIEAVSKDSVLQTLRIVHRHRLGSAGRWRIAVAGLNPHAGEGGLFGTEERDFIVPAIEQARAEGIDVWGPYAPDTVFMRARNANGRPGEFDVVVAQYHDQGLIPVKYLGVAHGVNITLGLPLVRTSPDHGTAFDIAGQGRADPSSLLEAIGWARQLAGGVAA